MGFESKDLLRQAGYGEGDVLTLGGITPDKDNSFTSTSFTALYFDAGGFSTEGVPTDSLRVLFIADITNNTAGETTTVVPTSTGARLTEIEVSATGTSRSLVSSDWEDLSAKGIVGGTNVKLGLVEAKVTGGQGRVRNSALQLGVQL
jgi:hypothetical protein